MWLLSTSSSNSFVSVHPCVCVGESASQFLSVECLCPETHHRGTIGSGQYEVGVVIMRWVWSI